MIECVLSVLDNQFAYSLALENLKQFAREDSEIRAKTNIVITTYSDQDSEDDVIMDLIVPRRQIYGFSCYSWNYQATVSIARTLKAIHPSALLVAGGPEVSFLEECEERSLPFDLVVGGEGEVPFRNLLRLVIDRPQLLDDHA